jgi:hypothetical protein
MHKKQADIIGTAKVSLETMDGWAGSKVGVLSIHRFGLKKRVNHFLAP